MVVLKKIRSATLIEVLVATLLITLIFMISSLVINNLLLNNFSKNTHQADTRLNELAYKLQNGEIHLTYTETFQGWQITIKQTSQTITLIAEKDGKVITKTRLDGNR